MSHIKEIFEQFNHVKVLIIGDVMIDSYVWGSANRLSPEAPVAVISVERKENRLGGAGNVALNIQAMGATPVLCSVIGNDGNALELENLLKHHKLSAEALVKSKNRITTVKTRIIGNKHQLLRVDEEQEDSLSEDDTHVLLERIVKILDTQKIDVVIFEDYDKGVITELLIREVVKLSNTRNIPVAVDPKKRNFNAYNGVTLFKPNLKELKEGLKVDLSNHDDPALEQLVSTFRAKHSIRQILLTLSEHGVYIQSDTTNEMLPAHVRNIADVSGAGDTVISLAALCLAVNTDEKMLAALANLSGGLVCESVGVVPINKALLLEEAQKHLTGLSV